MIEPVEKKISKRTIWTVALVVIMLISIFGVAKLVTSPDFNASMIDTLDEKKATVLKVSLSAAATSTALSLLPGDVASPIANEIAELTTYFIIILGAILLEKMLLSVIGHLTFVYIIPLACILGVIYLYTKREVLKVLAIKMTIFGLVLFMAIPASIKVSELIYASYETQVAQTLQAAEANNAFIEEQKNDLAEEDKNWFEKASDYLSNLTSKVGVGISSMIKKGEETLSYMMDTIAVLIITSCVLPIVVILIFTWIIKILFGFDALEARKWLNVKR
ncbi:MAG: hypothetical protein LCH34_10535 [Firmicutes bacterium]|nr:hypothetical protein [Bacillota bacterium]